jgi:hypothetical protein
MAQELARLLSYWPPLSRPYLSIVSAKPLVARNSRTTMSTRNIPHVIQLSKRRRVNLEQRVAYDRNLQQLRLPHYQRIFRLTESFPRQWRTGQEPSRADLRQISRVFHFWFFGEEPGGMFLTDASRTAYFALMNAIQSAGYSSRGADPISESESLLRLAEKLRYQLIEDLGTAEPPAVRWTQLGPTPAPPRPSAEQAPQPSRSTTTVPERDRDLHCSACGRVRDPDVER